MGTPLSNPTHRHRDTHEGLTADLQVSKGTCYKGQTAPSPNISHDCQSQVDRGGEERGHGWNTGLQAGDPVRTSLWGATSGEASQKEGEVGWGRDYNIKEKQRPMTLLINGNKFN